MRKKLGLLHEDFKAAMIKIFQQAITHMLETVKIIRKPHQANRRYKEKPHQTNRRYKGKPNGNFRSEKYNN